jgi:hypothetical protein
MTSWGRRLLARGLVVFATLLAVTTAALAQSHPALAPVSTTAIYLKACVTDRTGCRTRMTFADGALDSERDKTYCPPLAMNWDKLIDPLLAWLSSRPELASKDPDDTLKLALKAQFPCK